MQKSLEIKKVRHKVLLKMILFILIFGIINLTIFVYKNLNINPNHKVGEIIDNYNGVEIYYNGGINHISGRNIMDNYNIGLKYQCVEFVKRYYFEYFNHKMPNNYGNAVDFFDNKLFDGQTNNDRGLVQYINPSKVKPKINDILIYKGNIFNRYGHVAIISNIVDKEIEIIQQNPGPFGKSREKIEIEYKNDLWEIKKSRVIGWLRKE
jgi:surface antigen